MRTETSDELENFLDDLLTQSELEMCVKRFSAAYQLSLGIPYSFIQESTGLSSATIAIIAKKFDVKRSGYSQALKRLNPHGSKKGILIY